MAAKNDAVAAQRLAFYRRLVAGNRPELAQVWFDAAVLAPYRTRPGYKLFRSDTMGLLQGPQWRLDFGIAADDTLLHLSVAALRDQLSRSASVSTGSRICTRRRSAVPI